MENQAFRWRMVRQALLHKKARALLIVLALVMGSSVVTALLDLNADLRGRMNMELRDYGPNVIITSRTPGSSLHESDIARLSAGSKEARVIAKTAEYFVPVSANGERTVLIGADLASLKKLYPGWRLEGQMKEAVVGKRLARALQVKPGETISVQAGSGAGAAQLPVSGLIASGESEDDQVFVDLATAQRIGGGTGRVHALILSVLGTIPAVEKRFQANARPVTDARVDLVRKIAVAESQILDRISRLMSLVIAVVFGILFFCIHTTVATTLLSRQAEIALLRVLGARRKQILAGLTLELVTLALIGGLLGYLVGIFMAQVLGTVLFGTLIAPRLGVFVLTLAASVAMALVSSLQPIHRAVNRQAAVVLKEA